jgi:hypothetical protein
LAELGEKVVILNWSPPDNQRLSGCGLSLELGIRSTGKGQEKGRPAWPDAQSSKEKAA